MNYMIPTAQVTQQRELRELIEEYHAASHDAFVISFEHSGSKDGRHVSHYHVYRVEDVRELEEWLEDGYTSGPGDQIFDLPYFEDFTANEDEFIGSERVLAGGYSRYLEVWATWYPRVSQA